MSNILIRMLEGEDAWVLDGWQLLEYCVFIPMTPVQNTINLQNKEQEIKPTSPSSMCE